MLLSITWTAPKPFYFFIFLNEAPYPDMPFLTLPLLELYQSKEIGLNIFPSHLLMPGLVPDIPCGFMPGWAQKQNHFGAWEIWWHWIMEFISKSSKGTKPDSNFRTSKSNPQNIQCFLKAQKQPRPSFEHTGFKAKSTWVIILTLSSSGWLLANCINWGIFTLEKWWENEVN